MVRLEWDGAVATLRFGPPYGHEDEAAYLDALRELSDTSAPFALLAIFGGGGKLSQAGERAQALWFKATRQHFDDVCRVIAMVRPGASERMGDTFRRLWSMPIHVTDDEAAARLFIANHMSDHLADRVADRLARA